MKEFVNLLIELGYSIFHTYFFTFYKENKEEQHRFVIQFSSNDYNYSLYSFIDGSYALYLNEKRASEKLNYLVYEADTDDSMINFLRNGLKKMKNINFGG